MANEPSETGDEPNRARTAARAAISSAWKVLGELDAPSGTGVLGHNTASTGSAFGVEGVSDAAGDTSTNTHPNGVRGVATGPGVTYGVYGRGQSVDSHGVVGDATKGGNTSTPASKPSGIVGITNRSGADSNVDRSHGVAGASFASSGEAYGVLGISRSSDGAGIKGWDQNGSGRTYGVVGQTNSVGDGAAGVRGKATGSSGRTLGVDGITESLDEFATGVRGRAGTSGVAQSARGVTGYTPADADPGSQKFPFGTLGWATGTGGTIGTLGDNLNDPDGWGVFARGVEGTGVTGKTESNADGSVGVEGWASATSGQTYGVDGWTESADQGAAGVRGRTTQGSGRTYGVEGVTASNDPAAAGVVGKATGTSGTTPAIRAEGHVDVTEVGLSVWRTGTAQSINAGVPTTILFNNALRDDFGGYDVGTGVYTVQQPGDYHVTASYRYQEPLPGGTIHRPIIALDGVAVAVRENQIAETSSNFALVHDHISKTLYSLTKGQNIEIQAYQDSPSTQGISIGRENTYLTIDKVG